ncbi:MAG: lipid-A-disaccharide synthase [Cellvibrionaceae bacterium]
MKIGIVSGEASGDILGAGLIKALKKRYPSCHFSGIGGERMIAEGFDTLYPQDRLAVMGLIEPLKRLPELLRIRKHLYQYFTQDHFDVVIGIDSPDFNLTLEKKLRQKGIKTVHYVSPSVWAWRQGRIKTIKKAVDLMLTLLPFEADFYHQHKVPVTFVGHPLADRFPLEPNVEEAREKLYTLLPEVNLKETGKKIIAVLPGSRHGEVEFIGPTLWQFVQLLANEVAEIEIVVPALNNLRYQQIIEQLSIQLKNQQSLPIHVIKGHSQTVMAASDCVVMASGTTTLEAMLLKKPMVVVYKKSALSYAIISRLIKVAYVALPNLLANKELVPELLQDKATPESIMQATKYWLENPDAVTALKKQFADIHPQLQMGASQRGADAIAELIERDNIG